MTFSAFETVAVPFPFSDRQATKRRPALVISTEDFNARHAALVLAMITSAGQSEWPSDVPIDDRDSAGLTVDCVVRMKLFTLAASLIDRRLGRLSSVDQTAVQTAVVQTIAIA